MTVQELAGKIQDLFAGQATEGGVYNTVQMATIRYNMDTVADLPAGAQYAIDTIKSDYPEHGSLILKWRSQPRIKPKYDKDGNEASYQLIVDLAVLKEVA